ncbi:MAG: hypothetical protein AB7I79_03195 [Rhizobiaceae bacterium]
MTGGAVPPPAADTKPATEWVRWRVLSDGRVARVPAVPDFLLRGPVSREGYVVAGSPEEAEQRAAAHAEAAARQE